MYRPKRTYLAAGLLVAAVIAISVPQAQAFWGCYGWGGSCYTPCYGYGSCYSCCSPCYSSCCYSSCYSPCYTSCYGCCDNWYLGCRPGPIRRALFGPYKWYYGGCGIDCCGCGVCGGCCSWDTCGSICTPTCCGDTCGSDCGDACQPSAAPMQTVPSTDAPTAAPPQSAPQLPSSTQINTRENSGLLTIWVPGGAKVFINGMETKTKGTRRRYVSHGLQPGLTYKYVIRAEIVRNGKIATETKTVNLTAGSDEGLAFGFNVSPIQQFAAMQR